MVDGGGREASRLEPRGGATVQIGQPVGHRAPRLDEQHVAEQVVVPVPLAHGVEPDDELVAGGETVEPAGAVVRAGDRVEQRSRQPVHNGRLHHPATLFLIEHGEELVGEVAGDQLVVTAEGLDEAIGVVGALEREPGQHEPRGPTLGALTQVVEPLFIEPVGGAAEQGGGLSVVEPEVAGADLSHPPPHTHPSQPERRIGAGDQHDRQLTRAQVDEALDGTMHLGIVDHVIVVQYDDEALGQRRELVDDRRHYDLTGPERTGHQRFQVSGDLRIGAADRSRDRHPEACGIGVGLLQLQPRHRTLVRGGPPRCERRLAGAGRRTDQHEGHVGSVGLVQHGVQPGTVDQPGRGHRRAQLGGRQVGIRPLAHRANIAGVHPGESPMR